MKEIVSLFVMLSFFSVESNCQNNTAAIKGTYALKNVHTGQFIRIKDANSENGTPIVAYSPVNWKCVTWDFQKNAKGSYTFKNLYSDKTQQPTGGEIKDGIALEEQPINGKDNQQFEMIASDNNSYFIKLKGSELYITPENKDGETNSPIILQGKRKDDMQQWVLVEQHPTM